MTSWDDLPPVLTPQQVAELLHVSDETVRRYAAEGVIPGRQIGAQWRFSRDRIHAWIDAQDVAA